MGWDGWEQELETHQGSRKENRSGIFIEVLRLKC